MYKKIINNKQYFFSISLYLWSAVLPAIVSILFNPFLAKELSTYDYAIIGFYTSFNLLVLPIICFSFTNYYSRVFFLLTDEEKVTLKNTLITASLLYSPIICIICIICFVLYARVLDISLPLFPFVYLSFFSNVFIAYYNFYLNELKLRNKPKDFFKISIVNSILLVALSILFVIIWNGEAEGRFYAIALSALLIAIYSVYKTLMKFEINVTQLLKCLKFCWPVVLSSILFFFLTGIDKLYLEKLNNNYDFGLYNVAYQIVGFVGIISISILQAFSPDLYRFCAEKKYSKLLKIVIYVLIPTIVINLSFIPLSKTLISLFTFNKFTDAYVYADILVLRNIAYVAFFLTSDILVGLGLTRLDFKIKLICTILSIFLYKYFIEDYGFYGAAWVQSVSLVLPSAFFLVYFLFFKKKII